MRKRSDDMEEEAPAVHSVSLQLAKHGISFLVAGTCVVERTSFANFRIRYVRISEKIELITKDNARGALKWARGKSL